MAGPRFGTVTDRLRFREGPPRRRGSGGFGGHQLRVKLRVGRALGPEQQHAAVLPDSSAVRPKASRPASSSAASPATALSPATIRGCRLCSAFMHATAASSGMDTKPKAARSSSCQASRLGSPQARPAMTVSSGPSTA
jgi:hypothetical protein